MVTEPPYEMKTTEELKKQLKLYLILETSLLKLPLGDFLMQAVEGGVTAVRLRDKTYTTANRFETARQIASLLKGTDTLFLVNNSPDLAIASGANGVHVGNDDLPASIIKKCFPELLVGCTCRNEEDCADAISANADYVSIGPVFDTAVKLSQSTVLGIETAEKLALMCPMPSVVIGGIDISNVSLFNASPFAGIAISHALCTSDTPYDTALELISKLKN